MDLSTIPGLKPPPGVQPNLANPPGSYRIAGVVTVSLCLAFSTFFVAARLYTKVHVLPGKAGWEDGRFPASRITGKILSFGT